MDLLTLTFITYIFTTFNLCINTEAAGEVPGEFILSVLDELSHLQHQFADSEAFYKEKLAALEAKLHETEDMQRFYQQKVAEIEHQLKKSEHTRISYQEKLAQVENQLDYTEQRLINAEKTIHNLIANDDKSQRISQNSPTLEPQQSNYHKHQESTTIPDTFQHGNITSYHKHTVNQDSTDLRRNTGNTINLHIAFSSYISHHLEHLQTQQTIPFDEIITNEGNAYDTSTFTFTCPIDGVYMFQSALMAQRYKYIQTEIVKESLPLIRMYGATDPTTTRFDQGFNSVITRCNNGEKVWVRVVDGWGTDIRSSRFTTFSGYILWQL